jgi:hypothetical protein
VDDCDSTHRLLDQVDNPHSALWIRLTRNRCHPSTAIQGGRSVSAGWTSEAAHHVYNVRCQVGWQPSQFLTDQAEAERAFALAEQLGSVNAAAQQLGTTWPSLPKAFTRHGLGMPARNPEAVRQRAIAAASQRAGPPAAPPLDPVFVALNPGQLTTRRGPQAEQGVRLRRAEEIETLSYRTVVELNAESRLAPERRVATIARRFERTQRLVDERAGRADRWQVERATRASRTDRSHRPLERGMVADAR